MQRTVLSALLALLTLVLICSGQARAEHNATLRLSADHIAFYYDSFLVEADGNVRVQSSDGYVATGQAFSMDLKLNRFVLAGNVSLKSSSGEVHGAAISDFIDFDRIYFVPVTTSPDRWTFLKADLRHPAKGRVMPGDAFALPNLPPYPSLTATSATIGTKNYARFAGVRTYLASAGLPLGSYVVNFSSNEYFAQNSLTGANFDVSYNFAGNSNSLSAVHLREDTENGVYLAYEQHLVGDHEYAIFSVNPATKYEKFYNLQLYERLGERFQIQSFTQLLQAQYYGLPPTASTQTTFINATEAMPHSYLQLSTVLTHYNLLGAGVYNNPNAAAGNMSHPTSMQLTATSFQNRIGKLPLYEQIYYGYGFNHDSVGSLQYNQTNPPIPVPGLQAFGGLCPHQSKVTNAPVYVCPVYTTIWNTLLGFSIFMPSLKLGDKDNPYHTYYLNATFNKQRQWMTLPHYIDTTNFSASLSRQFAHSLNSYLNYQIVNTGDYYKNGGYPPCTPFVSPGIPNPNCPESLTAFRGVSTLRTTTLGINYVPVPEFNASILARHHDDFPIPVPGVFPLPTTNVIGQQLYANYLGQPPNDITGEVRFKFMPHLQADIARTYYFHFGTTNWSPSFIVLISPI